jgi:NTE family protein
MLNVKVCTTWVVVCSVVLSGCATSVKPIEVTRPVAVSPINASADMAKRPPKIGLALGGGAARGFAHVGVIQVLEQHGIRPDLVVGTSAGSLVAALYASGKNGRELEQAALAMEEASLTDWTLPFGNRGMLRGAAVARYVSAQTQGKLIENMAMPLGIVATDLANGAGILFQRGDAGVAVRASSSVPGVFQPVDIGGKEYVDGGLVAPVPVAYTQQMGAELVIAVDISSPPEANAANDLLKVMLQTFAIMMQTINRHELKQAHVLVRPELGGVGSAAFSERQRSMAAGRAAMLAAMPKLKAQMAALAVPIAR